MKLASSLSALSMVTSVKISNFRGFKQFEVSDFALVNVIVGDNAVGKTALLEAIYLAVSGSAQQPLNLKQWRGQDVSFTAGSADSVAKGFYADLFHDSESREPIAIELKGRGFENRSLVISRTQGSVIATTKETGVKTNQAARRTNKDKLTARIEQVFTVPISLTWTDQHGKIHVTRVILSPRGTIEFGGTNEKLDLCFLFSSQSAISAADAASQFSDLKKKRNVGKFRAVFRSVFQDIKDIDLGQEANNSVLMADLPWAKELLPLPIVSGGTNRTAAILLAITHRENGLVMVDEVENGVFYTKHQPFAKALLVLASPSYASGHGI